MLQALLPIHIGAGIAAILLGTIAIAVRKGGPRHVQVGTWFAGAMIALGVTAAILEPFRTPKPGSPCLSAISSRRHGWRLGGGTERPAGLRSPHARSRWEPRQ